MKDEEMTNEAMVDRVMRQAAWRGYVTVEDLMQLTSCDIPIYHRLAESLGLTPSEVKRKAEAGDVAPESLRPVLADIV